MPQIRSLSAMKLSRLASTRRQISSTCVGTFVGIRPTLTGIHRSLFEKGLGTGQPARRRAGRALARSSVIDRPSALLLAEPPLRVRLTFARSGLRERGQGLLHPGQPAVPPGDGARGLGQVSELEEDHVRLVAVNGHPPAAHRVGPHADPGRTGQQVAIQRPERVLDQLVDARLGQLEQREQLRELGLGKGPQAMRRQMVLAAGSVTWRR